MEFKKNRYDPQKMLSYNRILNMVIGARGYGKSFAMKKYVIDRAIKHKEMFMLVRRTKDDIKESVETYFNDIRMYYPDKTLLVKGKKFYCDGELIGVAVPLTRWQSIKSSAYPSVTTMIYDEFLKEKDFTQYIPNEPTALLNLIDTVRRDRDNFRCVCLSNSTSVTNPYFLYFGLQLQKHKVDNTYKRYNTFPKNSELLVEKPDAKDYIEEKKSTSRFYQMIKDTKYAEMAVENEFTEDDPTFIERKSQNSKYKFTILYDGLAYGYWLDINEGKLYVSYKHDPKSKLIFALTTSDQNDNVYLLNNWRKNYWICELVRALQNGYLRYDSQTVKNTHMKIFKKMNIQ